MNDASAGLTTPGGSHAVLHGCRYEAPEVAELVVPLVALVAAAVDGADAVSVSWLRRDGGRPRTIVATSEAAEQAEAVQYDARAGPTVEALAGPVEVSGTIPNARWEAFGRVAGPARWVSVWSLPFAETPEEVSALTVYSVAGAVWSEGPAAYVSALLARLGEVLDDVTTAERLQAENYNLREALNTRTIIGQAEGILMARERISSERAFDVLRRASQRTNRKLRDIAVEIVDPFQAM